MRKLGCGPSLQLQRKIPSFKYLATSARFSWTSLLSDLNVPNTCYSVLKGQHPSHPVFDPSLQWDGGGGGGGRGEEWGLFSQTVAGNRAWMNPTLQGLMSSWKGAGSKPHPQGWRTMSFVPQPARFSLLLFHRLTYHPSLHNPANSEKWKIIQIESFKKD